MNVAVPWSLSHYIPLNGFHPLYRALFDHAPESVRLHAWDNVVLSRRLRADAATRAALVERARMLEARDGRAGRTSVERRYHDYWWPPNRVLTSLLPGDIEFYHTAPFPSLERPFVLHCEMFAPLLFPFAHQGTGGFEELQELRAHYRGILRHPLCLGIWSHIPETIEAIRRFFADPLIDEKLFPSRIGLSARVVPEPGSLKPPSLDCPRFLFMNSAHQNPANFFRRGGHLVLRFWKEYVATGRSGRLLLRCARPCDDALREHGVDVSFVQSQTGRSILWGQDYLTNDELNALMASSQFMLLPSASLHSVSIMQAMLLGAVPVVTDTVGTSVYVTDGENGIVLGGMREAIWHEESESGLLIDRYDRMLDVEKTLVSQLVSRIDALLEKPEAYRAMRSRMMAAARERFSGHAFSDQFWSEVEALYRRQLVAAPTPVGMPGRENDLLRDCALAPEAWERVFESPTQPLLRINAGHSRVWELGGAFILDHGNPRIGVSDWSVMAQYYSSEAPAITFAYTIEELGVRYLGFHDHRVELAMAEIRGWLSLKLKPSPWLHRQAARVWRGLCRVYAAISSWLLPSRSDEDIELVREGVHGYNIIRHGDRYYAILQSEGAFIPAKVEAGGYSSCLAGFSRQGVERAIVALVESKLEQADRSDEDIELVREGVHGYNIIRHGDRYYAILQSEGTFIPAKVEAGGYSSCLAGSSRREVEYAILAVRESKPEQADALQAAERVSR
jgi:glycosyltransferase involved in cell wall biosynthesis